MILPQDFELRMKNMLNNEYSDFLRALTENPVYSGIRINTKKNGIDELIKNEFGTLENIPWCENGFYADKSKISGNHPYHTAGLFYFQEPSAMSTVSALPVNEDDYILDLCAAPGGKATQAGALLGEKGLLIANEIVKSRANILADNIDRFGLKNCVVTNETPQRLAEKYPNFFDKIIVDAPCSGEGMFRKEPQAIDEWSIQHTISCGERQKHILDCAFKMLRGGGYLVYSTCTFAPEENEKICAYILNNYNAELIKPNNLNMLSQGKTEWSDSNYNMEDTRRIFPHKNKGEGHFIALFRNLDRENGERQRAAVKSKKCDGEKLYREFENEFLNIKLDGEFCLFGENLYLKPKEIDIDKIKTIRAGLPLGICRKGRFEPSWALCTSLKKDDIKNTLDFNVNSEKLKLYMLGQTIECDKKGWCAVTVDGFPLSWGKASNGILKNHFPKYLRLKK
ncbi:MAG: NOL1/NOP2/sun family putative RNA methylase [Clostridia bacterium]|nr:NOL1/NOP2/sun family putative RNA methylase [Clostridia bacterium]